MSTVNPANISFELFPARTNIMRFQIGSTVQRLENFSPSFYSVTHGAFENPGDGSDETIEAVQKLTNSPVAAHVAASNLPKEELLAWVDKLYNQGIRKFVALRGDGFRKDDNAYYQSALEFVAALKNQHEKAQIYVSAYPEYHKDALSPDEDLAYLKDKLNAGADEAITQFFFDTERFYRWYEKCIKLGIENKIIAGILPIVNYQKTLKMANFCGAEIPPSLAYRYGQCMHNQEAQNQVSIESTIDLIESIKHTGVNKFHFYCLNQADLVEQICSKFTQSKLIAA